MTNSVPASAFGIHSQRTDPRPPVRTFAVFAVTLAISVVALLSPALMNASTRDLPRLRAGQWWRIVTPVLVQPSGWGQLVFNLLGLVVVGIVLQRYVGRVGWLSIYVVGGVGSSAVLSAWSPTDTGGGSSAAVAALIGSLAVLRFAANGTRGRLESLAELYSVFFVVYLTALAVGGLVPLHHRRQRLDRPCRRGAPSMEPFDRDPGVHGRRDHRRSAHVRSEGRPWRRHCHGRSDCRVRAGARQTP